MRGMAQVRPAVHRAAHVMCFSLQAGILKSLLSKALVLPGIMKSEDAGDEIYKAREREKRRERGRVARYIATLPLGVSWHFKPVVWRAALISPPLQESIHPPSRPGPALIPTFWSYFAPSSTRPPSLCLRCEARGRFSRYFALDASAAGMPARFAPRRRYFKDRDAGFRPDSHFSRFNICKS